MPKSEAGLQVVGTPREFVFVISDSLGTRVS
jgi:hypothetical protein